MEKSLKKILVHANFKKPQSKEILERVISLLIEAGGMPLIGTETDTEIEVGGAYYAPLQKQLKECDAILTIGGDGTILKWGKSAALMNKPLLGINTGRLGFMATLEADNVERVRALIDGDYKISRRMLLSVYVDGGEPILAMNDVVFFKDVRSKLIEFYAKSDNSEVMRIRSDGLILGTPTGSTAYSLSAGGPIIEPELECIELTQLCAHSIFGRPMIFRADRTMTVGYSDYENSRVYVTVDGDDETLLSAGAEVVVKKSDYSLDLIDVSENSFYNAVHNKLMQPLK